MIGHDLYRAPCVVVVGQSYTHNLVELRNVVRALLELNKVAPRLCIPGDLIARIALPALRILSQDELTEGVFPVSHHSGRHAPDRRSQFAACENHAQIISRDSLFKDHIGFVGARKADCY